MSNATGFSRILVVLDDSPDGRAAVEAAAQLAAELRAELQGLFVEDVNLIRLANLPFASEVCSSSAMPRPFTSDALERSLRAVARQLREWIEHAARRSRVTWSFEVRRGPVAPATLDAVEQADLVLIGRHSLAPRASAPTGSRSVPPVVRVNPVLVLFDGTPSAVRALEVAVRLSTERHVPLDVYLVAEQPSEAARRREAEAIIAGHPCHAVVHATLVRGTAELIDIARRRQAQLLLLNRESVLLDHAALDTLVHELECPIGVTR